MTSDAPVRDFVADDRDGFLGTGYGNDGGGRSA
jgi:hypothetical protein